MRYDAKIRRIAQPALFDIQGASAAVAGTCASWMPPFPASPNTRKSDDRSELYWVGPERWLLRAPAATEAQLEELFDPSLLPAEVSVTLVSDAYAFFEVSGPDAEQIMVIATSLDIGSLPSDASSFSQAFGLKALIVKRSECFEIAVERSYADMMEDCLDRARG